MQLIVVSIQAGLEFVIVEDVSRKMIRNVESALEYSPTIALRFIALDRKIASLTVAFWDEHTLASLYNVNLVKTFYGMNTTADHFPLIV